MGKPAALNCFVHWRKSPYTPLSVHDRLDQKYNYIDTCPSVSQELAGEDWDAEAAGAMSEEERERIRLRIHRFRLIDSRQTAG